MGKKVGKTAVKRKREDKGETRGEKRLKEEEGGMQGLKIEILPGFTVKQVKLELGEVYKTKGPATVF